VERLNRGRVLVRNLPSEALREVPYLNVDVIGDRVVNLMPMWDGQQWLVWLAGDGQLDRTVALGAQYVDYVAAEPFDPSDLYVPFVEFLWQRASWPEVCPLVTAIMDDFHHMATCVAKLRYFTDHADEVPDLLLPRFAETELEYLLTLARSVFDLLQEMVSRIWPHFRILDQATGDYLAPKQLATTFSRFVLVDSRCRTIEEMVDRWGISAEIADAYVQSAGSFLGLRTARDRIMHSGKRLGTLFATERGFCVNPGESPFDQFEGWQESDHYNDAVVSVLPWIAYVVMQTMAACARITDVLAQQLVFPDEVAPGYRMFVRAPTTEHLSSVLDVTRGGSPWWR
jgi:hypothetical protein